MTRSWTRRLKDARNGALAAALLGLGTIALAEPFAVVTQSEAAHAEPVPAALSVHEELVEPVFQPEEAPSVRMVGPVFLPDDNENIDLRRPEISGADHLWTWMVDIPDEPAAKPAEIVPVVELATVE